VHQRHVLHNLTLGFQVALSSADLMFCFLARRSQLSSAFCPVSAPVTTIAMLLPLAFKMPAVGAIIMLSGIYYGAHHAGSTTAIMLNMPGEPSSV
jgi:putative tricarboxylic transport membrane protein